MWIADGPAVAPIFVDPDRLQQVMWNLLANAVKFTPAGGRVEVGLGQSDGHVEVTVRDTGPGIEAEFLPYVFDRFRQADGSTTRRYGGLGLGLSIVRHLVEMHGGTVHVSSDGVGQGATFCVRLPLVAMRKTGPLVAQNQAPAPAASPAVRDHLALSGLRVQVVEDDANGRELTVIMLEQRGAEVRPAASVPEAMRVFEHWRPDVLVSDIEMPEQDGYQLIQALRSVEAGSGRRLVAVALTAHVREEDRARALAAGFDAHVAKPVDADRLVALIFRLAVREATDEIVTADSHSPSKGRSAS